MEPDLNDNGFINYWYGRKDLVDQATEHYIFFFFTIWIFLVIFDVTCYVIISYIVVSLAVWVGLSIRYEKRRNKAWSEFRE